ncbi:MAG: BadF/BadG/BcrA/BcrD ATPase family protein [Geminicoccaceae bacterium]
MIKSGDMARGAGLVGVDGGGTSCRIALDLHGQRTEVVLGRANVTTDFRGATKLIKEGLEAVAAQAGLVDEQLWTCPAYLGLAGVVDEVDAAAVADALPLKSVMVEDDRRATLVGALGEACGTVAGIGTGSFLARRSEAGMQLVGGWGLRLGDEASGAWLGRKLLASVLDVFDGLQDKTPLTEDVFRQFGCSPRKIVAFSLSVDPAEYAGFAPAVIEAAKAGDRIGRMLMGEGRDYLIRTMVGLGRRDQERICLIGGVAPHYQDYLPKSFAHSVVPAQGTALDGALQLAADMAKRREGAAP